MKGEKLNKITENEKMLELFNEIKNCHKCPAMYPEKALRKIDQTNLTADVFIVSQALARDTLRESGINFYKLDGSIGNTGKQLDKFLSLFDRKINPASAKCVYNTEIAQCYPGKNKTGKGDRKPSKQEMENCIHFLIKEINLINPKLILLMGKSSMDSFYKYIIKKENNSGFSEQVGNID